MQEESPDAREQEAVVRASCPTCGRDIDRLLAHHVAILDGRVATFCSPACTETAVTGRFNLPPARPPAWRRYAITAAIVVAGGMLFGARVTFDGRTATAALPAKLVEPELPPEKLEYGPDLPPADFFVEGDRWNHPLAGPVRRLPERPSRRFGVERDHDSPDSCRQGHCGVDVGEVKGEAVLAVHDGMVERVVREPTADRGGRYVRLLHNDGRIITQYMHLDAIEPILRPGVHVRAGEKIGTVGETGVKNSGPHLHFTVATRAGENAAENYIDPEPLLTLWPILPR